MNTLSKDILTALGRILLALIFIFAGFSKLHAYHQTAAYMAAHGLPAALLPAVIALELGGGIALALGLFTRFAAALLGLFSIAAIAIFLLPPAGEQGLILVLAETAMVGGLLDFAARGGGRLGLDGLRATRKAR
ncbi:MAG TPA: DoxX family protein [Gammaproteobacteria bacterium]|nr:DoxX family protein [Gammaproteobacteria bacterium]